MSGGNGDNGGFPITHSFSLLPYYFTSILFAKGEIRKKKEGNRKTIVITAITAEAAVRQYLKLHHDTGKDTFMRSSDYQKGFDHGFACGYDCAISRITDAIKKMEHKGLTPPKLVEKLGWATSPDPQPPPKVNHSKGT